MYRTPMIYEVIVDKKKVIDPQLLRRILSDGYLLCVATVEMIDQKAVSGKCTVVAIPRVTVRSAAPAADWIDVPDQEAENQ